MIINCLIIDDEPLAQDLIEDYISKIPFINLVAKCSSALEAFELLRNNNIDLIFLDIHMPNISGIDFIKSLETRPLFIFTTAYSEYAIEAFDLNAVDYLVKPIPFDRFLKATNKVVEFYNIKYKKTQIAAVKSETKSKPDFLFVKADYKEKKVNYDDILYIEGLKDYIKIHLKHTTKPLITHKSLKNMLLTIEEHGFIRIHKSYIIAIQHIKSITKNRVVINDEWIPIGDNYKDAFLKQIKV